MNEDDPIPSSTIRGWGKDPAYVDAVHRGVEERLERPLEIDALLVGIRFLHNFAKTPEGKRAVQRALDEGFVQLVPGSDGTSVYAIPRLLWRDHFYDNLCPAKGEHVSLGIQIARYMLWGPPGLLDKCEDKRDRRWQAAIREAIDRFEAEQNQRRQQLAEAIRCAAEELAARGGPACANDDGIIAISSSEIFELIRLTITDVTLAEVREIMQTLAMSHSGPITRRQLASDSARVKG